MARTNIQCGLFQTIIKWLTRLLWSLRSCHLVRNLKSDAIQNESLLSLDSSFFIDPNGFEVDSVSYLEKFLHQFNLSDHSVHSKNVEFKCRSYPKYNIKPNALKDDFFSKNSYFQHNVSAEKSSLNSWVTEFLEICPLALSSWWCQYVQLWWNTEKLHQRDYRRL